METYSHIDPDKTYSYQRQSVAVGDGRSKSLEDQAACNMETAEFYGLPLRPENQLDEEKNHGGDEFWAGSGMEGVLGNNKTRPTLGRLVELIKSGNCLALVVWSTCRLWRSIALCEILVNLMAKHGCLLFDRNGPIDLHTPDGRNRLFSAAAASQHLREMCVVNSPRGVRRSRERGLVVASSHILGYRHSGRGRVRVVTEEIDLVRRIFRMFVIEGMKRMAICRQLMAEGVILAPDLYEKRSVKRSKHTEHLIYPKQINAILTDPRYQGFQPHEGELHRCDAFLVDGEPAVSPQLFDDAQRMINALKRTGNAASPKNYLAGLFRCGLCGQYLTVNPMTQRDGSLKKFWVSKKHDIQNWCTHALPYVTEPAVREYTEQTLLPLLRAEADLILKAQDQRSTLDEIALAERQIDDEIKKFEARCSEVFGDSSLANASIAMRVIQDQHNARIDGLRKQLVELKIKEASERDMPVDALEALDSWASLSDAQKRIAIHKLLRWVVLIPSDDFASRPARRGGSRSIDRKVNGAPPAGKIAYLTAFGSIHTAIVKRVDDPSTSTWHRPLGIVSASPAECLGSAADLPDPRQFAAGLTRSYVGRGYKYCIDSVMPGWSTQQEEPIIDID